MNITIANTTIRQDHAGRFCLNDLHKAAGAQDKHRPSEWLRNKQTQELISEISIAGIPAIETMQRTGTFGCRDLIYAYATWISPAFFLKVIRAYDALATGQTLPRPGQVEALQIQRLKAALIKAHPEWAKIARYKKMGLSHIEIAKLVNLSTARLRQRVRLMEDAGIVDAPKNLHTMRDQAKRMQLAAPKGGPL